MDIAGMIDWREGEPEPRAYVGAVVLTQDWEGSEKIPGVVIEVEEWGTVKVLCFQECVAHGFADAAAPRWLEIGDGGFWPRWHWPEAQLEVFRLLYRKKTVPLNPERVIRVERD
jgi:hypothetical protein